MALSVALVVLLALMNLRGVRESGSVFAIPTYGFVVCVFAMLGAGRLARRGGQPAGRGVGRRSASARNSTPAASCSSSLVLRAFASGCTALTGVEAVSNGVPSFQKPKSRNAAATLTIMGALTVAMFAGITALALVSRVHVAADPAQLIGAPPGYTQRTVIAQIAGAVFGSDSIGFFAVQAFTAAILVLAANTAFNGFPILASILGRGRVPARASSPGGATAWSSRNGIVILSALAVLLIWAFDASTTRLIQLYIIGVFVSFTLSQAGMVRHWRACSVSRRTVGTRATWGGPAGDVVNALGAAHDCPRAGHRAGHEVHPRRLDRGDRHAGGLPPDDRHPQALRRRRRRAAAWPGGVLLPSRIHAVVLVSRLHTPALRALAFARATRPHTLTAVTVRASERETERLMRDWIERDVPVPLTVLDSPYRDVTRPVIEHIRSIRLQSPRDVVAVYIPEYVVGHWWEHFLHNQSALRLKTRLLFVPGVMVTNVPFQLGSADAAVGR